MVCAHIPKLDSFAPCFIQSRTLERWQLRVRQLCKVATTIKVAHYPAPWGGGAPDPLGLRPRVADCCDFSAHALHPGPNFDAGKARRAEVACRSATSSHAKSLWSPNTW